MRVGMEGERDGGCTGSVLVPEELCATKVGMLALSGGIAEAGAPGVGSVVGGKAGVAAAAAAAAGMAPSRLGGGAPAAAAAPAAASGCCNCICVSVVCCADTTPPTLAALTLSADKCGGSVPTPGIGTGAKVAAAAFAAAAGPASSFMGANIVCWLAYDSDIYFVKRGCACLSKEEQLPSLARKPPF